MIHMKEINPHVAKYIPVVQFLGETLGKNVEIVLHDLSDYDNSIIAAKNNHISQRQVGGPVTDLALRIMREAKYKDLEYLCNYEGKSKHGKSLDSSTYIIRDDERKVVGLLCINIDYSDFYSIKESIEMLLPAKSMKDNDSYGEDEHITESFNDSIENLITDTFRQFTGEKNIESSRLSQDEKINFVRQLHLKGFFLLKGAVVETANILQVSDATIYRYLNIVKREEKRHEDSNFNK